MPPSGAPRGLEPRAPAPSQAAAEPKFRPPLVLGHRHLQSMMTQFPWRRQRVRIAARELLGRSQETILDCGDGVRLQGFLTPRSAGSERGLVLLLHGWEGSASSAYILSVGSRLLAAGFSIFRLNLRDHGDTKDLNEGLFHSCRIDEVVGAVRRVREIAGHGRFAIVGHSLGGNFALRVAARSQAAGLELDRVIAVCPVLRPASTMCALDGGLWLYRRYFLSRWRQSLAEKAQAFPRVYRFGDLNRFETLTATTEFFVEHYTEFESLDEYLTGYAITGDRLADLTVSSRVIVAADDPVIPVADLADVARPDLLEITVTDRGGHCGFADSAFGPTWIDREILADLCEN